MGSSCARSSRCLLPRFVIGFSLCSSLLFSIAMAAMVGGLKESEASQNSAEIEELARFAVDEHNKKEVLRCSGSSISSNFVLLFGSVFFYLAFYIIFFGCSSDDNFFAEFDPFSRNLPIWILIFVSCDPFCLGFRLIFRFFGWTYCDTRSYFCLMWPLIVSVLFFGLIVEPCDILR